MPRSIVHLLFSILLLISQQMSLLHGFSHWTGATETLSQPAFAQNGPDGSGKTAALHDMCAQCAASAAVAFALPAAAYIFIAPELAVYILAAQQTPGACALTFCAFQPRAPPLA